jgi:hypothetical protein
MPYLLPNLLQMYQHRASTLLADFQVEERVE